jgi:hypothetical protein
MTSKKTSTYKSILNVPDEPLKLRCEICFDRLKQKAIKESIHVNVVNDMIVTVDDGAEVHSLKDGSKSVFKKCAGQWDKVHQHIDAVDSKLMHQVDSLKLACDTLSKKVIEPQAIGGGPTFEIHVASFPLTTLFVQCIWLFSVWKRIVGLTVGIS